MDHQEALCHKVYFKDLIGESYEFVAEPYPSLDTVMLRWHQENWGLPQMFVAP